MKKGPMVKKTRDKNVTLVNKRGGVGPLAKPSSGYALDSQSFLLKMVQGVGWEKGSALGLRASNESLLRSDSGAAT